MKKADNIFYLMQLAGGTFPSGGFSQSWGLETYVSEGKICDSSTFGDFLEAYLEYTVGSCEGPLICEAYRLAGAGELTALKELEMLSCAVKVTGESRESALRMGKALLRIAADMTEDQLIKDLNDIYGRRGISYPVIYGAVCGRLDTGLDGAVRAYVFSTANSLVQSALKLIPLGNTEAQKILFDSGQLMEHVSDICMKTGVDEISNFCPALDIAGIRHETLGVRLYMS